MAAKHILVAIAALLALSHVAKAELRGSPEQLPVFTGVEDRIIERNETLAVVARADPWLARQILDALAALDARPEALERTLGNIEQAAPQAADAGDQDGTFNPNEDPDLRRLERASPEALHDLFQLLKQAAGGQQPLAQ